ncbi:MAG: 3'-5' exonuclease [Bacillota bacterium]|nr:3'-5' exonuclease [Bacillota bacterium]
MKRLVPPGDYAVIDLETTGFSAQYHEIIEVAAIRVEAGKVTGAFNELVRPKRSISREITRLTGITTEMVVRARTLAEVLPDFLTFLGGSDLLGHNIAFDLLFLRAGCGELQLTVPDLDSYCTMRLARRLHPEWPHHRLDDLIRFYEIRRRRAHRALDDCFATQQAFICMLAEDRRQQTGSPAEMVAREEERSHPRYGSW